MVRSLFLCSICDVVIGCRFIFNVCFVYERYFINAFPFLMSFPFVGKTCFSCFIWPVAADFVSCGIGIRSVLRNASLGKNLSFVKRAAANKKRNTFSDVPFVSRMSVLTTELLNLAPRVAEHTFVSALVLTLPWS